MVVHEAGDVVDLLRGLFEAHGFVVVTPGSVEEAEARFVVGDVDAILLSWGGELGRSVCKWVFAHHRELGRRIVFVVDEPPDRVRRRCVVIDDLARLLEVTADVVANGRPRMLLVEDDPAQLREMAALLVAIGFEVTTAPSGHAAIERIQQTRFDVVLSDWCMTDGDGGELLAWVRATRPPLLRRLVFMTGGDPEEVHGLDHDAVVVPKGQDSPTLLECLYRAMSA